jgi:hypothetical protein
VRIDINGNQVTYSFEMSGFYTDGYGEITAVSFHYAVTRDSIVDTVTVHLLDLESVLYTAGDFDAGENKLRAHASLSEAQSFRVSDGVVDLFVGGLVSVTVVTKSQPFGEIFGPVRLVY